MEAILEILNSYTREMDPQLVGIAVCTITAILALGLLFRLTNAPGREKAMLKAEREKEVDRLCKSHTIGALRYAIIDGQLSVHEASDWFTKKIGMPLVMEDKPEEVTEARLPSILQRIKFKTA